MNKFICMNNSVDGKNNILKTIQYLTLFIASNLESNNNFKKLSLESYCKKH